MGAKVIQGAVRGGLLAVLIILAQPFYPVTGLIPELASFLVSVPLWIAAMIFPTGLTPLVQGAGVLIYFVVVGILVAVAFDRKQLWGWLFMIALAIHHYVIYDRFSRHLGEVVQTLLNYLKLG